MQVANAVMSYGVIFTLTDHNPPTLQTDRQTDGQTDVRAVMSLTTWSSFDGRRYACIHKHTPAKTWRKYAM